MFRLKFIIIALFSENLVRKELKCQSHLAFVAPARYNILALEAFDGSIW
jgi:hypothetical protein